MGILRIDARISGGLQEWRFFMKLYMVRHGETNWNIENRIQGQQDTELNEKGRQQARELADKLAGGDYQISVIYTSAKKRACETAQIVGDKLGVKPKIQPGIEEINFGKWEGYMWKQVREQFPQEYQIWRDNRRYQVPPEGESYQQLLDRLLPALGEIAKGSEGNALVVTHSAVIMTLMSYLYDTPFEDMVKHYKTGNAGIVELDAELFLH